MHRTPRPLPRGHTPATASPPLLHRSTTTSAASVATGLPRCTLRTPQLRPLALLSRQLGARCQCFMQVSLGIQGRVNPTAATVESYGQQEFGQSSFQGSPSLRESKGSLSTFAESTSRHPRGRRASPAGGVLRWRLHWLQAKGRSVTCKPEQSMPTTTVSLRSTAVGTLSGPAPPVHTCPLLRS